MNLGIITFHRALNYGAVLQAYALQYFLREMDIDSRIIDYRCKEIEYFYKPIKANPIKNTKNFLKECIFYMFNKIKRKKFMRFLNKNLFKDRFSVKNEPRNTYANERYSRYVAPW